MIERIKNSLIESADLKRKVADELSEQIAEAINAIKYSLKNGGKIMLMGNGGSAADAQHLAAEFIGSNIPAIALTTDASVLTSIANDSRYEYIFSRQIKELGNEGDILIAISTSGNSENVFSASELAGRKLMYCIGLIGKGGGKLKGFVALPIVVPSDNVERIQEAHITIGHIIWRELCREK